MLSLRSFPPLRVLVADDARDNAESLRVLLEMWGHDVRVAFDGESALEQTDTFRPDAVLLDIGMPGMDGCEVARRLRQTDGMGRVLILAVSGYGQEEDVRRCLEAGCDAHLLKPADPDALRGILGELANRRETLGQLHPDPLPAGACWSGLSKVWAEKLLVWLEENGYPHASLTQDKAGFTVRLP